MAAEAVRAPAAEAAAHGSATAGFRPGGGGRPMPRPRP